MINYLLQSFADLPAEAGVPEFLGEAEAAQWAGFRVEKRKREWLLGRWTAKRLVQAVLEKEQGDKLQLEAISIANDANGVPFAGVQDLTGLTRLSGLALSISHSGDRAFCATARDLAGLGADIEKVEPRSEAFVADYLTAEERERVGRALRTERDRLITAIWSGKEAVLKAFRLGLSVDTREIECLIDPDEAPAEAWKRFKVCYNIDPQPGGSDVSGWWRQLPGYVLTLAAPRGDGEEIQPVEIRLK